MKSLFETIKEAGIPFDSHESDLYLPATPQVREILNRFPLQKGNATSFINQVEGGQWLDIPFAYLPFWEAKQKRGEAQ